MFAVDKKGETPFDGATLYYSAGERLAFLIDVNVTATN